MKKTREEPGYYSHMLKKLAKIDGVSTEKKVTFKSIEDARKAKVKFNNMIFTINGNEIYCIKVEMINGVKTIIFCNSTLPVSDYVQPVSVIVNKQMKDYQTQPTNAGQYKYCEGGGWYSMANLYELNGEYYTDAY